MLNLLVDILATSFTIRNTMSYKFSKMNHNDISLPIQMHVLQCVHKFTNPFVDRMGFCTKTCASSREPIASTTSGSLSIPMELVQMILMSLLLKILNRKRMLRRVVPNLFSSRRSLFTSNKIRGIP